MYVRRLPCNVVKLQISSNRVSFSGTNNWIAFKLGLLIVHITGSHHNKFVPVRWLRCNVVKLQISRNRVSFSGTNNRITFKLGILIVHMTGSYYNKFVSVRRLPCNVVKLQISSNRVSFSRTDCFQTWFTNSSHNRKLPQQICAR